MKFAKELDQDLVPEWRAKYLDYKTGKKKVKAVSRALRDVNQTPKTPGRQRPSNLFSSATFRSPLSNRLKSQGSPNNPLGERRFSGQKPLASLRNGEDTPKGSEAGQAHQDHKERASNQSQSSAVRAPERQPLREDEPEYLSPWESGGVTTYGSIVASPPSRTIPVGPPSLELPDPAIPPNEEAFPRHHRAWRQSHTSRNGFPPIRRTASIAGDAYEVGRTNTPSKHGISLLPKHRNIFRPKRTFSTPDGGPSLARPPILRRMFSLAGTESPQSPHVPLEVYKEFDFRQADFFTFLDKELAKIESFYKMKEIEASKRLIVLKQQLHEMRDRRIEEVVAAQRHKDRIKEEQARLQSKTTQYQGHGSNDVSEESSMSTAKWIRPIENVIGKGGPNFGRNTKALQKIISASDLPPHPTGDQVDDSQRDFVRRRANQDEVPYRSAKRKLKSALQEFYRGLELLKSFSLLNRTAFRKINKKYDKAVNARPTGRYMSEKINKAWFVQSEVLDGHIVAVEDLYARYFERGNHKIAVGKLRSKHSRDNDYTANVFRNGVFTSAGVVLGIQGVVYGSQHLSDPDASVQTNTSYLLQVLAR
ncbi:hypothetical protein MMC20_001000 [Loxospora ochrophaea]|nr:hypothetical protein [Loxospora ochrophaea]